MTDARDIPRDVRENVINKCHWKSGSGRILIVVDCQIVQKITCGHAALQDERHRPTFKKIANQLKDLNKLGWKSSNDINCPIQWMPRELNRSADHMANAAMNYGRDYHIHHKLTPEEENLECNILVTVDGGSRETCSSIGWTLGLCSVGRDGIMQYRIVTAHGSFIKERVTSFVAELAALKEAVDYLTTSFIAAKVPVHQVT